MYAADPFGLQLIAEHRLALDDFVSAGEITAPVADLVQEAYTAAIDHVWLLNSRVTCYTPVPVNYAPASADTLVRQAEILGQITKQGTLDANTLARAQAAIEHDMAFYALSSEDVDELYNQILQQAQNSGTPIPPFENVDLEPTPEARAAAQFIIDLLTEK